MRSSEKTIFIIQLVSLIILLFNSIYHGFIGEIGIIIFLLILLITLGIVCGIPRDNMFTNKLSIRLCLFYSIAFLVFKYSLGLLTGFFSNPYSMTPSGIAKNVILALFLIVLEEICRFTINEKSGRNRLILITNVILFTFVNFALFGSFVGTREIGPFIQLFTTTFMTWLFYNIGLTVISYKHGLKTALVYAAIFYLYRYMIPVLPGLNEYVDTITNMLIPVCIIVLLHMGVPEIFKKKKNKDDIRDKHLVTRITGVVLFILIIIMVTLNSNLFRFWACVVGSGSMEPTINIGDIIIVDKSYKDKYNTLDKGTVLVFKINDKYYTHRVIDVINNNGEKSFITKGDRQGQEVDNWIVTKNEIVGVTKFRLKYIGLPAIWIRDIMRE